MNACVLIVSRKCESEADFMALYLLKRAGYDIHEFGRTLIMLQKEDIPLSTFKLLTLFDDHPTLPDRERSVYGSIGIVERDFESKYCVETKSASERMSKIVSRGMDYVWAVFNLFAWSVCCDILF